MRTTFSRAVCKHRLVKQSQALEKTPAVGHNGVSPPIIMPNHYDCHAPGNTPGDASGTCQDYAPIVSLRTPSKHTQKLK